MEMLRDPFLWALASMLGLVIGDGIQGSNVIGRSKLLGFIAISTVSCGRVALVLPFCRQQRFALGGWEEWLGWAIVLLSLLMMTPSVRIEPLTQPHHGETLRTTGLYSVVRHPLYLGNVLWGLGWAVAFGSTIGVWLTPVWITAFFFHLLIEEDALEREHGAAYRVYKEKVRARLIPSLL